MKAAQLLSYSKQGPVLQITHIEKPIIKDCEVLVKVAYAGINPVDYMIAQGKVKAILPYKLPITAGQELSGVVEAVGEKVKAFAVGDHVYTKTPLDQAGAFADYIALSEIDLALIPENLTLKEAATIPLAALTALQAFEKCQVKKGKTIFISGASGSFGALAIPLAKSKGLTVIASGNGKSEERLKALGVDYFIDYKKEDYTKLVSEVDYVIDTLGGEETLRQFSILKKGGKLVSLKGLPNRAFAKSMFLSPIKLFLFTLIGYRLDRLAAKNNQTYDFIFVSANGKQLREVNEIYQQQPFPIAIDRVYDFEDINEALKKVKNGNSIGKTLVKLNS
ncbi:NADP-dependent oxidoreductase [Streptococcus hongkongensis]|nr:oxidoreductase [Streptococcus uberis]